MIQEKLALARQVLAEATKLADEHFITVDFLESTYFPNSGRWTKDEWLSSSNNCWESSECVIG